jgi:hypothetical protein
VRTIRSEPALILLGPLADGFTAWLLAKGVRNKLISASYFTADKDYDLTWNDKRRKENAR